MRDNKARFANMTGSGSSVVGAFTNKKARAAALRALKDYYQSSCQYYLAEPCEGIEVLKKSRLS